MIEYNKQIGNIRFVNIIKTFKNIVKEIIELVRIQRNIINFFIKSEGFDFCFVNFKNPETWFQNDLMLAKIKITRKIAYVIWINGMTSKIDVSELNIVPLIAASTGNSSRITPNNGETPVMDNPVASLNNLIQKVLNTFGIPSNNGLTENELNQIFQEHQNARTTDKEQPKLSAEEYHLICKLLNREGINSGRIFYVLNRMVGDTV